MIYFFQCQEYVKIGTTTDLIRRRENIQICNPYEITCLGVMKGSYKEEREVHDMFKKYHLRGEWYILNQDITNYINKHIENIKLKEPSEFDCIDITKD